MDMDTMMTRMHRRQRGPGPGAGRSHGRPWRGIVENTPHIWVTWLIQAAKAAGRSAPAAILIEGVRIPLVSVPLTYGRRYYFVAPCCGRRVEAMYFLGREFGCRRCLHLGYASQASRPNSVWRFLDQVYDRRSLWKRLFRRYEEDDNPVVTEAIEPVRRRLAEGIDEMLARVSVEPMEQSEVGNYGGENGDN